jgi:hypothetical protein
VVGSGEQSVFNKGISNVVTDTGSSVSSGEAEGPPVELALKAKADCVPTVQLGYFRHFGDSDWLWGVKYSYGYLFAGRSFKNGFVYAGAGPALSRLGASLNDVVGFATIRGNLMNISGAPQSVTDTQWAFGVAASVGFTYFITPSCFLDVSSSFSNPFPRTFHVEGPFRNDMNPPLVFTGTLIGDYTAKVNTHLITASINVGF